MAVAPQWLADKSALARLPQQPVATRLEPLLINGLVATTPIIDLEILYSALSLADYESLLSERRALPSYPLTETRQIAPSKSNTDWPDLAGIGSLCMTC